MDLPAPISRCRSVNLGAYNNLLRQQPLDLTYPRFDTFQTNLLTIPVSVLGIVTMFIITLVSEMVNERTLISMCEDLWTLPFLIGLYVLPNNNRPWLTYVCQSSSLTSVNAHETNWPALPGNHDRLTLVSLHTSHPSGLGVP